MGPMDGIRCVELGVWVAGPAATGILADWGAEVVKIEAPAGDPMRALAGVAAALGSDLPWNPPFELDNRGKRSVVLDLSDPRGRDLALRLVDGADVFVTNLRLKALERLGLDPATLTTRDPRLVYGLITGYGSRGPDADRAAYDMGAFWARAGIAASLRVPGSNPPMPRGGMGDHGAATALCAAIAAALFHRERTGEGQVVETSLFRWGIYTMAFDLAVALRFGIPIDAARRETMANPTINSYLAGCGRWFWIVGLEGPRHWPGLARAVDHPEWIDDPRFAEPAGRARNAEELIGLLDAVFATLTREEIGARLDREGVFWAPAQTITEVLDDPQLGPSGALVEVPDGLSTTTLPSSPVDFGATPWAPRWMAPELGQHTDEVLAELGLDGPAIAGLRADGVAG